MDRLEIQSFLEALLGTPNVYFQPPPSVQMSYPAIVYKRDTVNSEFADDIPYRVSQRYQVTCIDRDPESDIPMMLAKLPRSLHSRTFAANNLNHDVFIIYF